MKYDKPEIHVLGSALAAVQSGGKGIQTPVDAQPHLTNGAYEADE